MREAWPWNRLGDVCENLDSRRVPITKSKRVSGNVPYYGASGIVDYVADYIFDEDLLLVSEDGANLLARTYPIAFSVSGRTWINNHAHVLRFKDTCSQRFIEYYFDSISLEPYVSGMAQPKLNQKSLNSISVPSPPLSEQKRIVAILDEAFAGIAKAVANAEKNLANARELFENHLNAVFSQCGSGWRAQPFEDCIEDVKYTMKIQRKEFLEEGEYPIVSQEADFTNGYWNNASDVFKVTRPVVIFGDHTKVFKYVDFDFVLGADGVKILPPKQFLNPKFFFYHLRSAPLKSLGYSRHYRLLKELQINYPDTNTQSRIAKGLDVLEHETQRLESIYQQKLDSLAELKQSILQKVFTGELTANPCKVLKEARL